MIDEISISEDLLNELNSNNHLTHFRLLKHCIENHCSIEEY